MKKHQSIFFIPGIIMLGIALRTPFAVLPVVLPNIAQDLQVSVSSLGILTSIPLIMFALCSLVAPFLAQKIGLERTFALVLFFMIIGSFIRIFNVFFLYVGTVILGATIAVLNVLLPSLIQANKPHRIGTLTTLYITSMGLSITIASALVVPIVQFASWKGLIIALTMICCVAFLVWLPNIRHNHYLKGKEKHQKLVPLLKNKKVWALILFGGLQSLLFYTAITWLPTLAQEAGLSNSTSGILATIFSLISLPFSLTVPSLTARLSSKQRMLMISSVSVLGVFGVGMLLFTVNSFLYWLFINLFIGISVSTLFPYLMVTFTLKTKTPEQTAQISGLTQTGGYILAALGPSLFGLSYDLFRSWFPAIIVLFILGVVTTIILFYIEQFDNIME